MMATTIEPRWYFTNRNSLFVLFYVCVNYSPRLTIYFEDFDETI